jgi:hypothetical protein
MFRERSVIGPSAGPGYREGVSVPDERYPDLHRLIERLEPEQAAPVREQILRGHSTAGLPVLGVFDGSAEDLGRRSEKIIRSELGRP